MSDDADPDDLIEVSATNTILIADHAPKPLFLRLKIWQMLEEVAADLPDPAQLRVYEGHRSQSRQFSGWNRRIVTVARDHPEFSVAEVITEARRWTADPVDRPSGHQAGAAVDLTLVINGVELDMGCPILEIGPKTPTQALGITREQDGNRRSLREIMERAGFLNYNEEWWHFSYNDRLWAEMKLHGEDTGTVGPGHYRYSAVAAY
jgi:D-alanyl-D-alanine dipeptidase